jgi:hypothetical protein
MLMVANRSALVVDGVAHFILFIRAIGKDEIIDHLRALIPMPEPILRLIHADQEFMIHFVAS